MPQLDVFLISLSGTRGQKAFRLCGIEWAGKTETETFSTFWTVWL